MHELKRVLELLRARYELKPVRVMVVKDVGKLVIDGVELELRKGTEVEVPRWVARILASQGYVEILESPLTLDDIARVHFMVTETRSLVDTPSLPEDFYQRAREYFDRLEELLRRNPSAQLLEEKEKAELYFEEILSRRFWTILQLLRATGARAEVYERLSPEEKILHDTLQEVIEEWLASISPIHAKKS